MKVLFINSTYGFGSTGKIVSGIADALKDNGDSVRVAYGRDDLGDGVAASETATYRIGNRYDVNFHALQTRLFDRHGLASKSSTKKLIRYIREYAPDVIHLHNIHGYYLNYEVLFSYLKKAGIPVVWTLHDCWAFTGHCAHYAEAGCYKWLTHCNHCPLKKDYPTSVLLDRSRNNFAKKKNSFTGVDRMVLVTPSKWLAGEVSKSFLGEYDIRTIYNGIDTSVFRPRESSVLEKYNLKGKKVALGVANIWSEYKGLKDFIEMAGMVDDSWAFILVGLTEEQSRGLPANIIPIRRTDNVEELVELYSAADVFINPSTLETMGLVTVEAMACGTPVITYNKTAVPEVVGENCGYVVDPDPKEIVDKLPLLNFKQEDCITWAAGFSREESTGHYLDLYREIKGI